MAPGGGLTGDAPLVLTLELDGGAFAMLDELRRRFYPPERNFVPAHLTLFHQLPGDRGRDLKALLRRVAASRKPIALDAPEVRETERGVALFLRSAPLHALREELAAEWRPWLSEQDRAGFRPHVTIQNGAGAAQARQTRQALAAIRLPPIRGTGLHLWRYCGGPWEDVRLFRFR